MSLGTDVYPHMPILCPHLIGTPWSHQLEHYRPLRSGRFVRFWASDWRAKLTKMGDSLSWTPMNHPAKYDAASFILGEWIRNRTKNKHTNSKRYIHTLPTDTCV